MKGCLLLFILAPLLSFSQPKTDSSVYSGLPKENGEVAYTRILLLDSLTKNQIYTKVKSVFLSVVPAAALQTDDKEGGLIAYRATLSPFDLITFKFFIKDTKLKIVLSDIIYLRSAHRTQTLTQFNDAVMAKANAKISKGKKPNFEPLPSFDTILTGVLNSIEENIKEDSEFDF